MKLALIGILLMLSTMNAFAESYTSCSELSGQNLRIVEGSSVGNYVELYDSNGKLDSTFRLGKFDISEGLNGEALVKIKKKDHTGTAQLVYHLDSNIKINILLELQDCFTVQVE